MKVLLIGGGGREHAIAWKLAQSKRLTKLYAAPGNGGISQVAECVDIKTTDAPALLKFALLNGVDFTVVGPDDPLAAGIVDLFEDAGQKIFGPKKNAAVIEYSKAFSKDFMKKYGIPTAVHETYSSYDEALRSVTGGPFPVVIKADGLSLGKGVYICPDGLSAAEALTELMVNKKFGESGSSVIIEEYLTGPEVTVLAFADGKTYRPMLSSQDHKRAFDNDEGPNTGGMGAVAPCELYTDKIARYSEVNIFKPTIEGMVKEGRPFTGVLYFSLMLTSDGPKVIEFNARFGDPEAQALLPLLKTDLLDIMLACASGALDTQVIEWERGYSASVVMASGGYPGDYAKGFPIKGLEGYGARAFTDGGAFVFHAGTSLTDGVYRTNGGRVLNVTAKGATLSEALSRAYAVVGGIGFEGAYHRTDIGKYSRP